MNPLNAYRRNIQTSWTRVEMLLALYDTTIQCLDEGIDQLNRQDLANYSMTQIKVTQRLLLLLEGIDVNSSEVAEKIRDLCIFAIGQIANPDISAWNSAREIMATLQEGFLAVREEAIELESTGVIPPLSVATSFDMTHA